MKFEEKEALALRHDMGVVAAAIRLRAARIAAGYLKQKEYAKTAGVSPTSLNNMEQAIQYPNHQVMQHLFREHRIDFNFLMNGDFAQLPGDVQESLFEALAGVKASTKLDLARA